MQHYDRGSYWPTVIEPAADENEGQSGLLDLERAFGFVRRHWLLVLSCTVAGALLGLVAIYTSVPQYTSEASILIDPDNGHVVDQLSTMGSTTEGEVAVASQVELLKSDAIAYNVVDKLDLLNDPDFNAQQTSLVSTIKRSISGLLKLAGFGVVETPAAPDATLTARRRAAIVKIGAGLDIERVLRTYVLTISYTSTSSQLAADISNAIGEAYLVDKLNSRYDATKRAGAWLKDRIDELRRQALASDLAVQKFRADNGLLSTGTRLVTDQQLAELNTALVEAQGQTTKIRAKLSRLEEIISASEIDAAVSDSLDSPISTELRRKYLDASRLESQISARLGQNHAQAVRLRAEMAEYKRLMFDELGRIAESYRSELAVDMAREKQLGDSVKQASGASAAANTIQVQLRELERESDTYRNMYQTFLERYQQALQQQSFPVTEARIISQAIPSSSPTSPKKAPLFVMFCMLGALVGGAAAVVLELRDRFFRTGEQIRSKLRLEYLGKAPRIGARANDERAKSQGKASGSPIDYVVEHPMSEFAETLRNAKIAIDFSKEGKDCKFIGITSTLPGEGKSTVAINLAQLLASEGARVILIDADLRNPGATRAFSVPAQYGLLEVLTGTKEITEVFWQRPKSSLRFVPAIIRQRISHSAELLGSQRMKDVLESLRRHADYVILDLPPLNPVVDAKAIARRIDGYLFVTEWGRTARRAVKQTLESEPAVRDKCVGVILNKVDMEKMKLYRSYGSEDYYQFRYDAYYREGV